MACDIWRVKIGYFVRGLWPSEDHGTKPLAGRYDRNGRDEIVC